MYATDDPTSTDSGPSAYCLPLPTPGVVVDGRYRVLRAIGAGGMGTVFEAEHLTVGRRYALKFLRSECVQQSHNTTRFRREARLLGRLEHDHLVAVLDYGEHLGKFPFLAMEYLDGTTLKELLAEADPLQLQTVVDVFLQASRGMAHVHACEIVHRDLKPANLMLTRRSDGKLWVKVLDFGIARCAGESDSLLTPSGVELGTAHYMSPEQARGCKHLDARSDIYALGSIIYEALTGVRVHPGESYNAVIFHLLTQSHRPLVELSPNCPKELITIVERCLQKDATRRYANAGELAAALSALVPRQSLVEAGRAFVRGKGSLQRARRGTPTRWLATGLALGIVSAVPSEGPTTRNPQHSQASINLARPSQGDGSSPDQHASEGIQVSLARIEETAPSSNGSNDGVPTEPTQADLRVFGAAESTSALANAPNLFRSFRQDRGAQATASEGAALTSVLSAEGPPPGGVPILGSGTNSVDDIASEPSEPAPVRDIATGVASHLPLVTANPYGGSAP